MVLGSTGMLGNEVTRVAIENGIQVIQVARSGPVRFNAESEDIVATAKEVGLGPDDYLVNCVGWIPQKSTGQIDRDRSLANLLNVELPRRIGAGQELLGFTWVQIATDCVFSGLSGWRTEDEPPDAKDLYGTTKIAGEIFGASSIQLRSSIIGYESESRTGLYAWCLAELEAGRKVPGFTNHLWNGVTTTAFARMVAGLVQSGFRKSMKQHWLPADDMSKFGLLQLLAEQSGFDNGSITPALAPESKDRRLGTLHPGESDFLWKLAGYTGVPSIAELVAELVLVDKQVRSTRRGE